MSETTHSPTPGWGHATGMAAIGPRPFLFERDALVHTADIIQAVNRYGWAYDERQLDALAAGFSDDAIWEGNVAGDFVIEPLVGRNAITEWLASFMEQQLDQRRHILLNHVVVAQTDSTAEVVTYLLLTSALDGAVRLVTSGFYRFELRRDSASGEWLITRLVAGFDAPF